MSELATGELAMSEPAMDKSAMDKSTMSEDKTAWPNPHYHAGLPALWILFTAEIRRYLAECRVYLTNYLSSMGVTAIVVSMFVFSTDSGSDPAYWVGFLFWNAALSIITESCISISSDKQSGTFTQLMLKPISMLRQIAVKTLVWSIVNILIDIVFLVALFLLIGAPVGFSWSVVPIAIVTFVGLFGLTMIMSSLTILYTKTASFCDLLGYAMMFLCGATIPLATLPPVLHAIGSLLPITKGITMSHAAIAGSQAGIADWIWLCGQSAVFVALGYVAFNLIMRHGRRKGIHMRY